jgi:hypothetical protein
VLRVSVGVAWTAGLPAPIREAGLGLDLLLKRGVALGQSGWLRCGVGAGEDVLEVRLGKVAVLAFPQPAL